MLEYSRALGDSQELLLNFKASVTKCSLTVRVVHLLLVVWAFI